MKAHYYLTDRELEVIKYIIMGYKKKKISEIMNLSYHTINTYFKRIYLKVGVHKATDLLMTVLNNQDKLEIPK